ncbi:MAG: hypothetical protein A2Y15_05470 [Clostridiales bacterium GWF2_36_10]|nr:MAG: hypothetical protein A2Y15_05470 [Clostridiales bacterium GWF2_36_10]HAN20113.1 hypothetical protein [Clostridiales bacterium]
MKYIMIFLLTFSFLLSSCTNNESSSTDDSVNKLVEEDSSVDEYSSIEEDSLIEEYSSIEEESSITELSTEESSVKLPDMTNLNYDNGSGKMGDTDGPAYAVYSKKGFNKASIDINISQIDLNNVRESDGKYVNAYMFLGMDIFNSSGNWVNCLDTGFCYSGVNGSWHLFYNLYTTETQGINKWYESKVKLDSTHDYRLTLDSSAQNSRATVTIYDITTKKVVDSKEFESAYSLADGSNTSYLQNYALDYPKEVKYDTNGKPSENDFVEITLYNTDQGIYMNNLTVENAKLCNTDGEILWTNKATQNRSMWPDKKITKIDYEAVTVWIEDYDNSFTLNLDMNR